MIADFNKKAETHTVSMQHTTESYWHHLPKVWAVHKDHIAQSGLTHLEYCLHGRMESVQVLPDALSGGHVTIMPWPRIVQSTEIHIQGVITCVLHFYIAWEKTLWIVLNKLLYDKNWLCSTGSLAKNQGNVYLIYY